MAPADMLANLHASRVAVDEEYISTARECETEAAEPGSAFGRADPVKLLSLMEAFKQLSMSMAVFWSMLKLEL